MSLEALILKAIAEGRFSGLTLWPCSRGYQANFKNEHGGWQCHVGEDPIAMLRAALAERVPTAQQGSVFD